MQRAMGNTVCWQIERALDRVTCETAPSNVCFMALCSLAIFSELWSTRAYCSYSHIFDTTHEGRLSNAVIISGRKWKSWILLAADSSKTTSASSFRLVYKCSPPMIFVGLYFGAYKIQFLEGWVYFTRLITNSGACRGWVYFTHLITNNGACRGHM